MKKLIMISALLSCLLVMPEGIKAQNKTKDKEQFKYVIDEFADIKVMRYQVPSWDNLSLKQQEYLYYLSQAAKKGQMYTEDNGNTLVFNLIDGYTYDESVDENSFDTRPLIRLNFKEQLIRFDVSDFAFKETEEDRYSNHYKMLNILQLNKNINELRKENSDFNLSIIRGIKNQITTPIIRDSNILKIDSLYNFSFQKDYSSLTKEDRQKVIEQASQRATYLKSDLKMLDSKRNGDSELIIRHRNELHRKFTLSAACLILFFIGAPLGAIIRKGGLGMPVVVSVLSFILYYVVGMIGEKASVEGAVSSFLGMWSSTLVFLPIGLFLTIKATSDSSLLNSESWIKGLNKIRNLLTGHKFENK